MEICFTHFGVQSRFLTSFRKTSYQYTIVYLQPFLFYLQRKHTYKVIGNQEAGTEVNKWLHFTTNDHKL